MSGRLPCWVQNQMRGLITGPGDHDWSRNLATPAPYVLELSPYRLHVALDLCFLGNESLGFVSQRARVPGGSESRWEKWKAARSGHQEGEAEAPSCRAIGVPELRGDRSEHPVCSPAHLLSVCTIGLS